MDPERAKVLIKGQIEEIASLRTKPRLSPEFKAWRGYTYRILVRIWGSESPHVKRFRSVPFTLFAATTSTPESSYEEVFREGLDDAEAILRSFVTEIDELGLNEAEKAKGIEHDLGWLDNLYFRFNQIVRQIKRRHSDRETIHVQDEYDVQDLLYALLRFRFDDIRPEEWTPTYAGGAAKMDFLLKDKDIVIETKMTRKDLRDRKVGSELIEDIGRYKEHPNCRFLSCFVYDPEGWISNPSGLEKDLSKKVNSLDVRVRVEPR